MMVTIQFVLNEENIKKTGYTVTDVEKYLRDFYAEQHAVEIAYLTFQRDDENAMCSFGKIMSIMRKSPEFMGLFSECVWNIDGEEEDIIAETLDYERRHAR